MKISALCTLLLCMAPALLSASDGAPLDAKDLDALRGRAGAEVSVNGEVVDVGTTKEGGITFLNIGLPKKQGFVAVVFRDNYDAFPDGFEHFRGKTLTVTGTLELFRGEQPQIVVRSPSQIVVVGEDPAGN